MNNLCVITLKKRNITIVLKFGTYTLKPIQKKIKEFLYTKKKSNFFPI